MSQGGVLVGLVLGLVSRITEWINEGNKKGSLSERRREQGRNLEKKREVGRLRKFLEEETLSETGEILKTLKEQMGYMGTKDRFK